MGVQGYYNVQGKNKSDNGDCIDEVSSRRSSSLAGHVAVIITGKTIAYGGDTLILAYD